MMHYISEFPHLWAIFYLMVQFGKGVHEEDQEYSEHVENFQTQAVCPFLYAIDMKFSSTNLPNTYNYKPRTTRRDSKKNSTII